jgi:hypothetical protein
MHDHIRNPITRLLALAALVLALLALAPALAGAATTAQNERVNSGWYTGLEYADLPSSQTAADDDGFPWQNGSFALGSAIAALLLVTAVAKRGILATR